MVTCNVPGIENQRRRFWATQPSACAPGAVGDPCSEETPTRDTCGFDCGRPGLQLTTDCEDDCDQGTSVATTDWIRGLAINMLMTDGKRVDSACGYRPGGQGGHWSESFMQGEVGTLLRTIEPQGRINDLQTLVSAYARATLDRLVTRGVASSIDVETRYLSNGRFQVQATIYGTADGTSTIGLATQRLANGWVWE